jgi:hypothetical protein
MSSSSASGSLLINKAHMSAIPGAHKAKMPHKNADRPRPDAIFTVIQIKAAQIAICKSGRTSLIQFVLLTETMEGERMLARKA